MQLVRLRLPSARLKTERDGHSRMLVEVVTAMYAIEPESEPPNEALRVGECNVVEVAGLRDGATIVVDSRE